MFKATISIKTRNPIIFGFHPSAQKCSAEAGAPEDGIQWIDKPSLEATSALMNNPKVALFLATDGYAMVKMENQL
ncbi:hypothetical protein AN639_09790 [Candidatus Epulonipiscium fishelsonii]|uniref:Uncharacterized protein n=1 Tax=Candidatus Epulonipiscium fishelsonii TaxID=77094 RepID=A0ACC8XGC6_9FIRM|nr:hypothetical protein AN639_09790 [Epulopiscium sp. SCG-B05WGA-EpuloA1]ONI42544.1 hypothetical protein AN396_13855 [Epulopiscium sp. SCG-B11WGA-EpuloA1]ONI47003.1 hypothetical protein AN644_02005 [Epulopiscium sp. SCG-C06WGA-EpuloA1]